MSAPLAVPDRKRPILLWGAAAVLILAIVLLAVLAPRPTTSPRTPPPATPSPTTATLAPLPEAPAPPVEPLVLRDLTRDQARAINAAVPFVPGKVAPAASFRIAGTPADRAAATACLAAAAWWEAGDDPVGQQAVVQVVLNRQRHPAYPATVCGVVFQGSERTTGCQFSFTCDGSMARRPSDVAWDRARKVAERALAGLVFKPVGYATSYHTDWVVPYWSATLDKIAAVHTHLFFRWRGYWGTASAFRGRYAGGEVVDPRVPGYADLGDAALPAAADGLPVGIPAVPSDEIQHLKVRAPIDVPGVSATALKGHQVLLADPDAQVYALALDPEAYPGSYPLAALALCRDRDLCTVAGWIDPDRVPDKLPMPLSALRSATFLYRRGAGRHEQILWNCRQRPRDDKAQCMPGSE